MFIAVARDWLKKLAPLFHPVRGNTKPHRDSHVTRTWPARFCRALPRLHVFGSSFDWFIILSVCFVIGQSENFSIGSTTLIENCSAVSDSIRLKESWPQFCIRHFYSQKVFQDAVLRSGVDVEVALGWLWSVLNLETLEKWERAVNRKHSIEKKMSLSFGRWGTRHFLAMAIFRPRAGLLKARLSLPRISENFNLILGL